MLHIKYDIKNAVYNCKYMEDQVLYCMSDFRLICLVASHTVLKFIKHFCMISSDWVKKTRQTQDNFLDFFMTGWSLEEAEVAARDCKIWGNFLHQAAGARLHDAI